MKYLILFYACAFLICTTGFGQRDFGTGLDFDRDLPSSFEPAIVKIAFREIDYYDSQDSLVGTTRKTCTKKEFYNDSGRLIRLISGPDLLAGKINYEVNFYYYSDSLCKVRTEYQAWYVDSLIHAGLSAFAIDTVINKKYRRIEIYKREKNRNVVVYSSVLDFKNENGLPGKILFYDKDSVLHGVSHPNGNRTITREWTDSSSENGIKTINHHILYPENEYYWYKKYSNKDLLTENGFSNYSPNSTPSIFRDTSSTIVKTSLSLETPRMLQGISLRKSATTIMATF